LHKKEIHLNTFEWTNEIRFVIALALGFLIGLERESSGYIYKSRFAGLRTYTIISLLGFGCGWFYKINIPFVLPVGLISVTALVLVGYFAKFKEGHYGWTSEIAAVLTYVIGALTILTDVWVPLALGVVTTLLLSEKSELEKYVEKLDKSEFLAVIKFLVVTLIILPVLPNQEYTKYLLNPYKIWLIVIFVSSLGFAGYILIKKFGDKVGLWVSGIMGGIVSSTAVTIAVARIAEKDHAKNKSALQAALLASSVMYIRILFLVWLINPSFIVVLWWKLIALSLIGIILSFGIKEKLPAKPDNAGSTLQNPFEIKPALIFAGLFVILSVLTIIVKNYFGNGGLITLSAITGVTDIDPFILSLIRGTIPVENIIIASIVIAMMSNTIIKGIYFVFFSKQQSKQVMWRYILWALLHIPFAFIFF
jgi:uncharacterized membrane protein (DUF4010 family)